MNIIKPFPMLPTNFGSFLKSSAIISLLVPMTFFGLLAYASIPVEEIRGFISKEALFLPSPALLAALGTAHLEVDLRAIDPYAKYIPPSSLSSKAPLSVHLGIEVFPYKSMLWMRPDTGGPADQAGIPEIVALRAINGKKINTDDLAEVSAQLDKAIRKSSLNLTIFNLSSHKEVVYLVKPSSLQPSSITYRRVGTDLVVQIRDFVAHDTAPKLYALYKTVVRNAGTRVIFDLRGCSGGDLYEAIEIAGMFVSSGLPLVSTYNREGMVRTYRAPPGEKLHSPIWVLIDRRTASSAEILAGILQHYHLTHLVGEPSFGKFVSQTIFPLSNGGKFWLTTLAIRLPDGVSRNSNKIKPDIFYPDISITRASDIIRRISEGNYGAH